MVGTSGAMADRFGLVTANAWSVPSLMNGGCRRKPDIGDEGMAGRRRTENGCRPREGDADNGMLQSQTKKSFGVQQILPEANKRVVVLCSVGACERRQLLYGLSLERGLQH